MSCSRFVNTPTLVEEVPTSALGPAVLRRTCIRSGKKLLTERVQNDICWPSTRRIMGVISQLLMTASPEPLLKFAPT